MMKLLLLQLGGQVLSGLSGHGAGDAAAATTATEAIGTGSSKARKRIDLLCTPGLEDTRRDSPEYPAPSDPPYLIILDDPSRPDALSCALSSPRRFRFFG